MLVGLFGWIFDSFDVFVRMLCRIVWICLMWFLEIGWECSCFLLWVVCVFFRWCRIFDWLFCFFGWLIFCMVVYSFWKCLLVRLMILMCLSFGFLYRLIVLCLVLSVDFFRFLFVLVFDFCYVYWCLRYFLSVVFCLLCVFGFVVVLSILFSLVWYLCLVLYGLMCGCRCFFLVDGGVLYWVY